ncbi:hypothetical protein FB45DRAFT_922708 [Roridomyces roridus]|uniref:Secreted protein n=1 Tax=Roridomyces roridus TaxID=1738132 RepID=A0AAD7BN65_9AGAR|nr:hypothetical protein FB45DRAFT_922708 [Roridomyces roridus]
MGRSTSLHGRRVTLMSICLRCACSLRCPTDRACHCLFYCSYNSRLSVSSTRFRSIRPSRLEPPSAVVRSRILVHRRPSSHRSSSCSSPATHRWPRYMLVNCTPPRPLSFSLSSLTATVFSTLPGLTPDQRASERFFNFVHRSPHCSLTTSSYIVSRLSSLSASSIAVPREFDFSRSPLNPRHRLLLVLLSSPLSPTLPYLCPRCNV